MIAACLPCGIFLPPCSMEFETCGVYDTKYRERNNIAYCFCFCQPEVSRWTETTTSGIEIPVELIGSDIQPVVMLETLNVSR